MFAKRCCLLVLPSLLSVGSVWAFAPGAVLSLHPVSKASISANHLLGSPRRRHLYSSVDGYEPIGNWSIQKLLQELDCRGIPYPASASRENLEGLLLQTTSSGSSSSKNQHVHSVERKEAQRADRGTQDTTPTLSQSQTSSSVHGPSPVAEKRQDEEERTMRERRRRRRRRQLQPSQQHSDHTNPSTWWVDTVAVKKLVDGTKRKARLLSRGAADFFATDEKGVRDVRFEYTSSSSSRRRSNHQSPSHHQQQRKTRTRRRSDTTVIDVPVRAVEVVAVTDDENSDNTTVEGAGSPTSRTFVHPPTRHQSSARRQEPVSSSTNHSVFAKESSEGRDDHRRPAPRSQPNHDSPTPPTTMLEVVNTLQQRDVCHNLSTAKYNLPPPRSNQRSDRPPRPRRPQQTVPPDRFDAKTTEPKKKIYSPYNHDDDSLFDEKDVVDRVGEFLADTADQFMWGKFDVDASAETETTPQQSNNANTKKSTKKRQRAQRKQHWKDRLEQRVDTVLGVHEDGDFYTKWTERQRLEDQIEDDDYNAFSVAQGRRPKRAARKTCSKPFWEEDGSLIALLLGRSQAGKEFSFKDSMRHIPESGSVLFVLRACAKYLVIVTSYLSRWASTQGALPQPVVVFGVAASGICAPPRRRIRTVLITLLLIRTVGELLHGSTSGMDGWEEDDYSEDEEEEEQ